MPSRSVIAPVLAACALAAAGCGSTPSKHRSSPARPTTGTTSTSTTAGGCTSVSAPAPRGPQHLPKPKLKLDPGKRYVVTLQTNCGAIQIELAVKQSPKTAASFAYLVQQHFYDGLTFHRVVANFVIQGGDPLGNGQGGPGYQIVEPPPSKLVYKPGIVAMAKTGTDPSGASGSQFFIVTGPQAQQLPPQYAYVGNVIAGQDVAARISFVPANPPSDGSPTQPIVISKATLSVK